MNKILPYRWMILTGIVFSLIPFSAKEINLGEVVITREQALDSGLFYLLIATTIFLFAGIYLSLINNNNGDYILKFFGVLYSIIFIPFVYMQLGILNVMLIVIMLGYSVAWYYGASKIITSKNA